MKLRILAGASISTITALLACSGGSGLEISRDDPDYGSFHEGYNYKDGKAYLCAYKDKTILRRVDFGASASPNVAGDKPPGLHDTSRATLASSAQESAIRSLRAGVAPLVQIGSCDLSCEQLEEKYYGYGSADASFASMDAGMAPSAESAKEASTTNNQVAGVDEADFIKNDNKYMYVVANGTLKIIEAFPAATARTLATVSLTKGTPIQLLTGTNRLIVYSAVASSASNASQRTGNCTYGFDCVPTGDGSATHITVLDITDKSAPTILRELDLSGSLIAARRVGDAVHTVVYDAPISERLAMLARTPIAPRGCLDRRDDIDAIVAELEKQLNEKEAAIRSTSVTGGPAVTDGTTSIEPTFRASNQAGDAFLSLVSFGISGEAAKAESLVSRPGFVYASSSSLYVSVPHDKQSEYANGWYAGYGNYASASEIYKFSIGASASATQYQAAGFVKGTVLNQFALDEWGGNLRVATTVGRAPNPGTESAVTVFEQQGASLVQKGIVDHIAPTEDIRSVRFDGDRGFVVTFKKTDPLYALDLANPAAPRITGELKIPGFSTYMHFMDRTHILALGLEADDKGSFAWFNGVQLQIFDISNMAAPTLMHKTVIGTRGSNSEALTNHLGFNYFAPKQLLALPMTICEGGGNGNYGANMTFNGLLVYNASVAGGFSKIGGIPHEVDPGTTCMNWWTRPNTSVKRSVIMDDYVYSVAEDEISISGLSDLSNPIRTVDLL